MGLRLPPEGQPFPRAILQMRGRVRHGSFRMLRRAWIPRHKDQLRQRMAARQVFPAGRRPNDRQKLRHHMQNMRGGRGGQTFYFSSFQRRKGWARDCNEVSRSPRCRVTRRGGPRARCMLRPGQK